MRKRQFGKGRSISAAEQNLAQNYLELNSRDIAVDAGLQGIITGGLLTPHITLEYTIILEDTVARTSTGERVVIAAPTNLLIKPSVNPGLGNEVYVTAYLEYAYQLSSIDTDEDGIPYYKDYQNSFSISTIQGDIATIGNAIKPDVPVGGILLCDVKYDALLYITGAIDADHIDISRQDRYDRQLFEHLVVNQTTNLKGAVTIESDLNMSGAEITNIKDPTDASGVGDRAYNDDRYINKTGDTMEGALTIQDLIVTNDLEIQNIDVLGELEVEGTSVFEDDVSISGNFAVNLHGGSIGKELTVYEYMEARGVKAEWQTGVDYTEFEVIFVDDNIYKCINAHTSTTFSADIANWLNIGGPPPGGEFRVEIIGHGYTVGTVLRYDSTVDPIGFVPALADDLETVGLFVVSEVINDDTFIIMTEGYFTDSSLSLVPNTWYYCSDTIPGALTYIEPAISNPVLYAISDDEAFVYMQRPRVGATSQINEYVSSTGQMTYSLTETPIHKDFMTVSIDGDIINNSDFVLISSAGLVSGIELDGSIAIAGGEEVRINYWKNTHAFPGVNIEYDSYIITSTGVQAMAPGLGGVLTSTGTEVTYTSTGGVPTFNLSFEPITGSHIIVSINGTVQHRDAYSVAGTVLIFTSTGGVPTMADSFYIDDKVEIRHILNMNLAVPALNSIESKHLSPTMTIYKGGTTIDEDILLESNGLSIGPITVSDGYTVTVAEGYTWKII